MYIRPSQTRPLTDPRADASRQCENQMRPAIERAVASGSMSHTALPSAAEGHSQGAVMSAKKTARRRSLGRADVESPGSSQSPVERRSAEAQVRALIAVFAPTRVRLIGAARRWLRKRLPTAHEVVYEYRDCFVISYSPSGRGYEGVLAIRASADGVRLYFNRGTELPDPGKLLHGSGSRRAGSASKAHPRSPVLRSRA